MKELEIEMYVNGTVHQSIVITDNDLSPDQVREGIKEGSILTSIGHSSNNGKVYQIGSDFKEIGYVKSQESCDDLEISWPLEEDIFD